MVIKGCISGIYKIMCLPTGKIYVGSSVNINNRWGEHRHRLRKNIHSNTYLQNAWNKYREQNFKFEIIEIIKPDLLTENELKWFKKTNCCNPEYGFNIGKNPDRTMLGRLHSKESRLKMSNAHKGKIFTDEHRKNISKIRFGKKHSEETKQKIGIVHKGKIVSIKTIENMKRAKKGLYKGSKNPNSKLNDNKIIQIRKLHSEGKSNIEIAKIFNISRSSISLIINNKIWKHIK